MIRRRNSEQRRAERHLFVASIAATACADRDTGFPSPEQVAAMIDERCRKHGVEHVHVAPTIHAAVNALDVYVVAEESSSEKVVLVIPFDGRRFLTAELRPNGDVTTGNGISYQNQASPRRLGLRRSF
jgi:hypothetical protein